MPKNEAKTDIDLFNFLTNSKEFYGNWIPKKTTNTQIQEVLSKATKSDSGKNRGEPDLIYLDEDKKLLILIENKDKIKDHKSKNENKPKDYAVDGIKHYLKFFLNEKLENNKETTRRYLEEFRIVGIAFSGDIHDEINHLINTFIIQDDKIKDISIAEFLNEQDYISLFENLDLELISNNISKSSSEINRILRNIDSQKRPVLLSALMICLYEKESFPNDFKHSYLNWSIKNIIRFIPTTINDILLSEDINQAKIDVLLNELSFIKTDKDLNDTDILRDILIELEDNVIPLFNKKTSYDIIGKFYEEFLRYAGIANVKKGIVLTPNHITKLFTKLIDIRTNDIIFDACCGTGAFLIAGMNQLIDTIQNSKIANKQDKIKNIKQNQLLGFEKSNTMYSLAISNMLFRGDGKSKIFNIDFFSKEANEVLNDIKPTIGFINPPYGGKDNKSNPTKKEIQFLEKMLDNVSRFGVIIAPLSTYFKDEIVRNRILSKHTLKYVINMPNELFAPNASTHTAIAVFETNLPHDGKKVVLHSLDSDGFVLSKNKGRTDVYNKWNSIEKDLLIKISQPKKYHNDVSLLHKSIDDNDEWILQAHMKTNYSELNEHSFILALKQHLIFEVKQRFNLLFKSIDELSFMDILVENNITSKSFSKQNILLENTKWQEFNFNEVFFFKRGKRLRTQDQVSGEIVYISSTKENNGIDSYITPPINMKIYNNCITLNNSGSIGYCFYHTYDFVASDHCTVIKIKDENIKLSNYIFTFLKPIIEAIRPKYGFAREISDDRLDNEVIKLPILKKDTPDWKFMENYIKTLPYSKNI